MTTYKAVKVITGKAIYDCRPCSGEFEKFVDRFGFHKTVEFDQESFEKEDGWIEFLLENDFIESAVEFDECKIYVYASHDVYKLHAIEHRVVGDRYTWTSLTDTCFWSNGSFESVKAALDSVEHYHTFNNIEEFAKWMSDYTNPKTNPDAIFHVTDYSYSKSCDTTDRLIGGMRKHEGDTNTTRFKIVDDNIHVRSESPLGEPIWLDTRIKSLKTGREYFVLRRFLSEVK